MLRRWQMDDYRQRNMICRIGNFCLINKLDVNKAKMCEKLCAIQGLYRARKMVCKTYLIRAQAGPSCRVKEQQEGTSPNHVQAIFSISVNIHARTKGCHVSRVFGNRKRATHNFCSSYYTCLGVTKLLPSQITFSIYFLCSGHIC